jgi:hypothetical protein
VLSRLTCCGSLLISSWLVACSVRHPLESDTLQNRGDAAASSSDAGVTPPRTDTRIDAGISLPVPDDEVLPAGCTSGLKRPCGATTEAGICQLGSRTCSAGVWGACEGAVQPSIRLCSSPLDNDCDGQPDNEVDTICQCQPNTSEPCETHPGLDGVGRCLAGKRDCVLAADGRTSEWGECKGSVAPLAADSCSVRSDDSDCDGNPNGGCACVDGDVLQCGHVTVGICQTGTSTCVNGKYEPCVGSIGPQPRDCRSDADNDCDGVADNTLDSTCTCAIGDEERCGAHPGQDGVGICRAGVRRCGPGPNNSTSTFGACIGSFGPAPRNCAAAGDNDCDGRPDNTLDAVCACAIGSAPRACGQHPGQDGNGPCRAGTQSCLAGMSNASSSYGACLGAVGPTALVDSCLIVSDDSNCSGTPNDGCACIAGIGCSKPEAALCQPTGVCAPCVVDADCAAITGAKVCSAGLCVQCTASSPHACAATQVCNAVTQTCTEVPPVLPPALPSVPPALPSPTPAL